MPITGLLEHVLHNSKLLRSVACLLLKSKEMPLCPSSTNPLQNLHFAIPAQGASGTQLNQDHA